MLQTRQKTLRRFWYPVIPVVHLKDGPKPFTLLGEKIALFVDSAGRPAAIADRCCHRTTQLSRGFTEGDWLVCGYHGWTYDRTGRCVRIPQRADNAIPAGAKIPSYHCEARYGYAWVALEAPLAPIPEFEEASDPIFRQIDQLYDEWKIASFRLMENSFDVAHVPFTHRNSFGIAEQPRNDLMKMTPLEYGLETFVAMPVRNRDETARSVTGTAEAQTVRTMRGQWWMPFIRRLAITYPNGLKHSIITNATPMEDGTSMVIQWAYRSDREEDAPAKDIIAFDRKVTEEDRYILEATDYDVCIDTRRRVEFHMETDEPGLLMRQKWLDLLREQGEDEVHG